MNEQGQAVGFATLPGEMLFHATLWAHVGKLTDLGTVGTDACSYSSAINAYGQIVGGSISLSNCLSNGDPARAFLWEDGAIFDLNSLIPPGSALYLISPDTINDLGEISGTGADVSGNEHAFLLIPCDENHPGIEGCDYSLVVSPTAVEVHPAQAPQASATASTRARQFMAEMMAGRRSAMRNRYGRFGLRQQR